MGKWTQQKIVDDNWSVKECIDELYEFDEAKSVSIERLSIEHIKASEINHVNFMSINSKLNVIIFINVILFMFSTCAALMYFLENYVNILNY